MTNSIEQYAKDNDLDVNDIEAVVKHLETLIYQILMALLEKPIELLEIARDQSIFERERRERLLKDD